VLWEQVNLESQAREENLSFCWLLSYDVNSVQCLVFIKEGCS
jgi:hypothetical protein